MQKHPKGYTYKRMEESDIPAIQEIFWKVFNVKHSLEHIRNKYNTDHVGTRYTCCVAYDGQKPIAMYGNLPQLFSLNGETHKISLICDSFTLKEYQKQRLHRDLALMSYDIMAKEDFKLVYAFHSENTYFSSKKLDWLDHARMERFHLSTGSLPVAKGMKRLGLQKNYDRFVASKLAPYAGESSNNPLLEEGKAGQVYDEAFYRYKETYNPHHTLHLEGCVFWVKIESVVQVGFFDAPSQEAFHKAITQLKKIAAKLGVNELLFQTTVGTKQSKLLSTITPPQESWRIGSFPFASGADFNDYALNFADIDVF